MLSLCASFFVFKNVGNKKLNSLNIANKSECFYQTSYSEEIDDINDEKLIFSYNNKIFVYKLKDNIKKSSQFDIDVILNKYDRFKNKQARQELLQHLINIGIEKDVALNYIFPSLNKVIKNIKDTIQIKPKNASVKINSNTEQVFYITDEVIGISVDEQDLYDKICNAYINGAELRFIIPIKKLQPKILAKDLKVNTFLRADFSTDISSSTKDRKHNIKNAINKLDKLVVAPNEIFSFNKSVGKRTQQNGYRQAKIIVNNEFVDGLGGGVCQVSSTLYNSALLAGFDIIEANKHSKQVGYVKYGFDAMVNFGSSDLKFKNNTNSPITIIANYTNSKIRFRIYGENLNGVSYKLTNEIVNVIEPSEQILKDTNLQYLDKVIYDDEFFYLKHGQKGMEVYSYRLKYKNDILLEKTKLRHDKFSPQDAIKVYGIKKRNEINYI